MIVLWGLDNNKIKLILVGLITCFLLIGIIVSTAYWGYISSSSKAKPENMQLNVIPEPDTSIDEPSSTPENTRGKDGGELKWSLKLSTFDDSMLSTPTICDLNPPAGGQSRKYLETVVACTDDHVYAVDHKGTPKWTYSDCVIDDAITATSHIFLDFSPPPLFSSVVAVDIAGGKAPELLVGEQDGILCIAADGTTHWQDKGSTDGYYFSSIVVCDIEGDYSGIDYEGNFIGYRDDLEIVLGSDNNDNADAFLECWQANGKGVFRYGLLSGEHAFMTCSIVSAELDGWLVRDGGPPDWIKDQNPDTLYADFMTATHDCSGRIWKHEKGQPWDQYYEAAKVWGHETYSTATVTNFTGGQELECIEGYGSGASSWESSVGAVVMYRQDGSEVGNRFSTGSAPSSVFSSPASCDAQNLDPDELDEGEVIDYEVFFGCDNGKVYCLSAKDLSPLWEYQTGDRILSSPAICNIDSDDSLEVVIGSNDGKVYCFEADPREIDCEGKANPKDDGMIDAGGDSGTYDVLWIFDTSTVKGSSGEIGISSPVVGDIDYDGQLEVLIGDNGGTLYCISAGGKCIPGQVDWPKFHNDLNNTGFYDPAATYGVDIKPRVFVDPETNEPHYEILKKSVRPGESVTYNLTVTNIGKSKTFDKADTFWLQKTSLVYIGGILKVNDEWPEPILTGDDLKWSGGSAGVGKPYVVLKSFESANVTLEITAPWTGDLGEVIKVQVETNSSTDIWSRDSIGTTTSLEIFVDFDLAIKKESVLDTESELYGQKVIKINPGDRANVVVGIMNKGNLNDSYDLEVRGVLWGWKAYFESTDSPLYQNALKLDAPIMEEQFPKKFIGSEGEVNFTIEAPPDAQENDILNLKVIASSTYSQHSDLLDNITRYDYLIVITNPIPDLELKCKEPRQYVVAGENTTFDVEVINRGNSEISVKLEHSQLEPGWSISFRSSLNEPILGTDAFVDVMKNGVTSIKVEVHAPCSAAAGSRQNIILRGTSVLSGDVTLQSTDTVALTAIVSQFYDINVTVDPQSISTDPGRTIVYNITVINEGNGDDFVIITPTILEINWDTTFYLNHEEHVTSELVYNESVTFQMEIKIPKDQIWGSYATEINISGMGDRELVKFYTKINKIYNLSIYGVVHSEETSDKKLVSTIQPEPGVAPGSILYYVFEIRNSGNAPDEITLKLESIGELWESWEGILLGITNTEAYITETEPWDFSKSLDISKVTSPTAYLNSNSNPELHVMSLQLRMDQTVWLKVQITVPTDIDTKDAGSYRKFNLHTESTVPDGVLKDKNLNDNDVLIDLKILFPDLAIVSNIRHPSSMVDGEIVTISAEIKNAGEIEAREVLVTFYMDEKEVKTQMINLLPKGNIRLIPFTWQALEGEHKLTIKVDPEDAIVEKYENNNEKTEKVEVKTDVIGKLLDNRAVCSIIPVIIAIVILLVIMNLKKRGKIFGSKPKKVEGEKT